MSARSWDPAFFRTASPARVGDASAEAFVTSGRARTARVAGQSDEAYAAAEVAAGNTTDLARALAGLPPLGGEA